MKDNTIFFVDYFYFNYFNYFSYLIYFSYCDYLCPSMDCFGELVNLSSSKFEVLFDKELENPLFLFIAFRSKDDLI